MQLPHINQPSDEVKKAILILIRPDVEKRQRELEEKNKEA